MNMAERRFRYEYAAAQVKEDCGEVRGRVVG